MSTKLDKENLNIEKQIRLLESLDSKSCEDAKSSLSMLVQHGKGIPNLVNYFCSSRSERALEILYRVADPYHNILLDTLKHITKEKKLPEVLALLGQILQKQPSWVNQVVKHSLFSHIIGSLRSTRPIVVRDVISGMFFMSILLPLCTDTPTQSLQLLFQFFVHSCETLALLIMNDKEERDQTTDRHTKERLIKDEVEPEHCGVALREYFHAIYGIFPIQFTNFLRMYFTEKQDKKRQSIHRIIVSLMNGVRLHPYLIFHTKEWEASSQRYEGKTDAAFFLDYIRQMTIGVIPVPVNFVSEEDSEDESASVEELSSKGHTFTFGTFDNDSSSSSAAAFMEETADLLNMINTPPGSRPDSPTKKSEITSPMVLTEPKIRRPSGEGVRQTRLASFSNTISSMLKRSERKSVAETIEVVKGNEEGRRSSQCSDGLDEGEDALVDLPQLGLVDRRKYYEAGPSTAPIAETKMRTPVAESGPPPSVTEIVEEAKQTTSSLLEAAKAARAAIQERKKQAVVEIEAEPSISSIRSRSASLKPAQRGLTLERGRTCTMDAGFLNSAAESDSGEMTPLEEQRRDTRFSVSTYFNRLNRQRFVSECPQRVELPVSEAVPLSARAITLDRTFSCPNLNRQMPSFMDGVSKKFEVQGKSYNTPTSPQPVGFFDRYPYLKIYQPLDMSYLHQLEEKFAAKQEKKLGMYMAASRVYHSCLKDLGLADRLPGRIYDDLSHITQGIPLEKQRDMFQARLQLVNQHLMYERSCRLLHALRNRRLFVQICGENNLKAQLQAERQLNYTIREEVEILRDGLTAKRKEMIELRKDHEKREQEMTTEYKRMRMEAYRKQSDYSELSHEHANVQKECKEARMKMERQMRRADDAEQILKGQEAEIAILKERMDELKRAHEENSILKEQLIILESGDRLRSPEMEEKMRQALLAELDRVTKKREVEQQLNEELRERMNDLEQCLRAEQTRSERLSSDLIRSAKVLREQNEAAEQKFLSLQLVNDKHLELINDLYAQLETAKDAEAAYKAAMKTHDSSEIPQDPPSILFGTTTREPTSALYAPNIRTDEEGIFQFEAEPELDL